MIVTLEAAASREHVDHVVALLKEMGADSYVVETSRLPVIEVLGSARVDRARLEAAPMVSRVLDRAFPLLAGDRQPGEQTDEISLGPGATIGGQRLAVIAGPCSVESRGQLLEIAAAAKEAGAVGLRGGAFKPRTTPYSFQGLGESGLEILAEAREETGLAIVTEVMCCEQVDLVARYADVFQVGSRNMHNSHLLNSVGRQDKPVLLKRGWSSTLEELLMAAEYVMQAGNEKVMLCERGIRTHETHTRNTLDLSIVPAVKAKSRLPIVVDPSHGTGRRDLVIPMSKAAVACGADGLLVEIHVAPDAAWSDAAQTVDVDGFFLMMKELKEIAAVCGREL